MKRAYRTTWNGITSIVAADSVSQARAMTERQARSAGYQPGWIAIRVVRATEHDAWAAVDSSGRCWDESNLPKINQEKETT